MTTKHAPVRSRHAWRARPWKDFTTQPSPTQAFIHHGAETDREAKSITNWTAMYAAMRETQNFHMNTRGWSDIAYHAVIFQKRGRMNHPNICLGRPANHVPAAQLSHNTGTFAICVFGTIDESDPLRDETVEAIAWLLRQYPRLRTVGGHRDVTQTDCPGNMIYHQIGRIAKLAGLNRFE